MRVFCALALLVLAASGCASSVRFVRESADGGVIAIPSNSNQWPTYYRNRAEYLMNRKCPHGYAIDREEVVEDNPASRDGRYPNEDFEYNGAYERISRYARTEHRITFHCVPPGASAPPLPPY